MFCNQCGAENRNDRKFCANCGASLTDYTKPVEKEELLMPQDVVAANEKAKADKKRYIIMQIISYICLCLAVAGVLVAYLVVKVQKTRIILLAVAIVLSIVYLLLGVSASRLKKTMKAQE